MPGERPDRAACRRTRRCREAPRSGSRRSDARGRRTGASATGSGSARPPGPSRPPRTGRAARAPPRRVDAPVVLETRRQHRDPFPAAAGRGSAAGLHHNTSCENGQTRSGRAEHRRRSHRTRVARAQQRNSLVALLGANRLSPGYRATTLHRPDRARGNELAYRLSVKPSPLISVFPAERGSLRAHSDPRAGPLPEQTNDHVLARTRGRHAATDRDPVLGGPHLDDGARLRVVVDDRPRRLAGRDRRARPTGSAGSGTGSRCARGSRRRAPSRRSCPTVWPAANARFPVAACSPWRRSRSRRSRRSRRPRPSWSRRFASRRTSALSCPSRPRASTPPSREDRGPRRDGIVVDDRHDVRVACRAWR